MFVNWMTQLMENLLDCSPRQWIILNFLENLLDFSPRQWIILNFRLVLLVIRNKLTMM